MRPLALGRKQLAEVASLASPETILRRRERLGGLLNSYERSPGES